MTIRDSNPFLVPKTSAGGQDSRAVRAENLIKSHVIAAMGAGVLPLTPIFDIVAVTAIEVRLIAKLAELYSVPVPRRHVLAKVLISIAGGIAPVYLAAKSRQLVTSLPWLGYGVYLGAMSIWSGVAVYAVGKIFQQHFESGGTLLSLDNRAIRELFEKDRLATAKAV